MQVHVTKFWHKLSQQIIPECDKLVTSLVSLISAIMSLCGKSQEHHNALRAVCQHFTEIGLTLNEEKCQFNQNKGISANPVKVDAVNNAPLPHSLTTLSKGHP